MKTKKIIHFISAILVIANILSACNNNKQQSGTSSIIVSSAISTGSEQSDISGTQSDTSDVESNTVSNTTSTAATSTVSENEPAGVLTEPHLKTIKGGVYMLKIKELPFKLGDDIIYSDYTCYYKKGGIVVDKSQYGTTERTIILDDAMYSVITEIEKIFKSKTGSFYNEQGFPKLVGLTHHKDSVEMIDGTLYDIESFKNADDKIVSFLYKNKQLKRMRSYIPSLDEYAEYEVEFKASYDNKVFDFPSDFDIIELS